MRNSQQAQNTKKNQNRKSKRKTNLALGIDVWYNTNFHSNKHFLVSCLTVINYIGPQWF